MISAEDLTALRAAQAGLWPDTCTVHRVATEADDIGGVTSEWTATEHVYSCRLSIRGVPDEFIRLAATRGKIPWMVTLPVTANVTRADRLVTDTQTLEILGFASGGAWETAKRAVCVEVD